jgi:hypothetical protein
MNEEFDEDEQSMQGEPAPEGVEGRQLLTPTGSPPKIAGRYYRDQDEARGLEMARDQLTARFNSRWREEDLELTSDLVTWLELVGDFMEKQPVNGVVKQAFKQAHDSLQQHPQIGRAVTVFSWSKKLFQRKMVDLGYAARRQPIYSWKMRAIDRLQLAQHLTDDDYRLVSESKKKPKR